MMKIISSYLRLEDERGSFNGIINYGLWSEINIIKSVAGASRGKHYHKETVEGFFIIDGLLEIKLQKIEANKLIGEKYIKRIEKNTIFIIEPMVMHEFKILENSTWINFLSLKMDTLMPDIHKI